MSIDLIPGKCDVISMITNKNARDDLGVLYVKHGYLDKKLPVIETNHLFTLNDESWSNFVSLLKPQYANEKERIREVKRSGHK